MVEMGRDNDGIFEKVESSKKSNLSDLIEIRS
jgi:hypothetical protein